VSEQSTEKQSSPRCVIVGGGVVGAFCAWFLSDSGRKVTIIDQSGFGAGCSHGNCGYVSPSHVFPLPAPGQLSKALRGMLSRKTALRIAPRLSPTFWWWLWKFALRCNHRDMMTAGRSRHALLQSSAALYRSLIEEHGMQVEWQTKGLLFVFRDQSEFDHHAAVYELLKREFEVEANPVDGRSLCEMEPALREGLAGAWHYTFDAHLRPDRLMSDLKNRLQERGVEVVENCRVQGFVRRGDRAVAVKTESGEYEADEVVAATGPLTPLLNRELGCRIPIQPGKGYSITMPRPKVCPTYPMLLEECHVGITPFESGFRVGSTMEFVGYNSELSPERLQYLRDGAAEYLLESAAEPVEEEWFGWRPMTWDGLPYIDRSPLMENVLVAAGHNMLGLSMGPATGKLVAELMTGSSAHIDPAAFRIGR
jgi:D-amino-acid dehydrogenase